jgi:hypothetical protein
MNQQVPLFFEEDPEELNKKPEKTNPDLRAGTTLDHRWCHDIMVGKKQHGIYDESHRVYQTGGVLSKFIYWRDHLVTLDARVWRQIIDKSDWIEVIDHERNECWRISATRARKSAKHYDAGIGERVGVPMDQWTVYTADGRVRA